MPTGKQEVDASATNCEDGTEVVKSTDEDLQRMGPGKMTPPLPPTVDVDADVTGSCVECATSYVVGLISLDDLPQEVVDSLKVEVRQDMEEKIQRTMDFYIGPKNLKEDVREMLDVSVDLGLNSLTGFVKIRYEGEVQ